MKKYLLRAVSALTCLASLSLSAACSSQAARNAPDASPTAEVTSAAGTAAETDAFDSLARTDYGGGSFTILLRKGCETEFYSQEQSGDTVNDAIYSRNRRVEEAYDISLGYVAQAYDWGGGDTFNASLVKAIMAGDSSYDLVAGYAAMILGAVEKGLFVSWYDVGTVNVANPWWSEQIADCLTINKKLYAMTGDAAISLWNSMECIYFNKKLASDYKTADLYSLVRSGDWTFDQLEAAAKLVSGDLDGNGSYDENDLYGYITNFAISVDAYQQAFAIKVLTRGDDGFLTCTIDSERTVGALSKLADMFFGGGKYALLPTGAVDYLTTIFKGSRALFMPGSLNDATGLRDMDTDFGILPFPKYDGEQDSYYSTCVDSMSLLLIPSTVKNAAETGTITEAMGAASYSDVIPVYYNVVLKDKYSRDADSAQMIDTIRDSVVFDIGYLNSFALDQAGHLFVQLVRKGSTDISALYAANAKKITADLAKMQLAYQD